jgi:TldD protein
LIDFQKVLKAALREGGDFADIFLERTLSTSITCEDNRIERVVSGTDSGVGIRVIFNKRSAYAFSNDLSGDSLLRLAETAAKAARGEIHATVLDLKKREPSVRFDIRKAPWDVPLTEKVGLVERGNRAARGYDERVRQVAVIYRDTLQDVTIANSEGVFCVDRRVGTLFLAHVVAAEGDVVQTGYEPVGGHLGFELFDSISPEEVALIAARRGVMMLSARKAPAGKMPVVLSSDAGGTMIHEAVGHGLEADLAQQGLSVYTGKVGEQIASPLITVIDDSTIPGKRGSFAFDDEGTESRKRVLIENGVLKGYMYDRLTAMKDGVSSTGNGRRESYQRQPIPRMTNTLIAPGSGRPEDIVSSVGKGLFVKKMGGGQVNTVNGDFVFEVSEGYIIENGSIGEPVRGATLTGNGPEVLRVIDMVGNDLGFSIGTCGKDGQGAPVSDAQPTLRIPEIIVGGHV